MGSYGKYIRIRHLNGYKTAYAHLSAYKKGLSKGSRVNQGETIAYVGSTGRSTGPQLTYEIIYNTNQKEGQILSMKLFNSNSRFIASWSYMKILLYCVFNITIMWTLIVPWNTHPTIGKTIGLGALFWILVAVIILTASIVQYYYIYTDTRKKNDDGSNVNDEKDDNTNNKIIAY